MAVMYNLSLTHSTGGQLKGSAKRLRKSTADNKSSNASKHTGLQQSK